MATSGTVTWRPDIEEIITDAYERCGIETMILTGYMADKARRSLNFMFADWSTKGINYWKTTQRTLSLVSGTSTYALPAGTIDVLAATLKRSGNEIVTPRWSLTDYQNQPDKTTSGRPTQYYFDRQYTPNVIFWPVPENSTDTWEYWSLDQVEDVTASNEDADVPHRWTDAMASDLAVRLYTKQSDWDPNKMLELKDQRNVAFDAAATDEGDRANLVIIAPGIV